MRPLRRDYKVLFRREEAIETIALDCRRQASNHNLGGFNIITFVEDTLRIILRKLKKGHLFISFFNAGPDDDLAYVKFAPTTLHIDQEIWDLAKLGDPVARYIVAHEIGHLVLHDHDAKAFSTDPNDQISFETMSEYSAEWQANIFAGYFLLPTHVVDSIGQIKGLVEICSVTADLAGDRLKKVRKAKTCTKYSGDACANCGNFTVLPNGVQWRCDTCEFTCPIFNPRGTKLASTDRH